MDSIVSAESGYKPTNENRKAVFKRLLSLNYPETIRIILGISGLIMNSITNLSFPWIMGQAIDKASLADDASSSMIAGLSNEYIYFLLKAGSVFLCGSVASWIRIYCLGTSTDRIANKLRRQLFAGYLSKNVEYYDTAKSGEVIKTMETDVSAAAQTLTDKLASGIRSVNSCINGSILLFSISPRLCGVALGVVPFVGVGAMYIHKYVKKLQDKLRVAEADLLSFVMERFHNITTIRVNHQEHREIDTYYNQSQECYIYSRSAYVGQGKIS